MVGAVLANRVKALLRWVGISDGQNGVNQTATSMPIWRGVPARMRHAASRLVVFRSAILSLATSSSCLRVILATFFLFASLEPDAMFATFFRRFEAGGCLVMNVKLLSLYTVM